MDIKKERIVWGDVQGNCRTFTYTLGTYSLDLAVYKCGKVVRPEQTKNGRHYPYLEYARSDNGKGYKSVVICAASRYKRFYVHRLVAEAFIPNHKNFKEVNHNNFDKSDNSVENLSWCDQLANKRHYMNGRTDRAYTYKQFRHIIVSFFCCGDQIKEIAESLGVTPTAISSVVNGNVYTDYLKLLLEEENFCEKSREKLLAKIKSSNGNRYIKTSELDISKYGH